MDDRLRANAALAAGLALLAATAAGCAGGGDPGAGGSPPAQPAAAEEDAVSAPASVETAAGRALVAGEPVTVRLELPPALAERVLAYRAGSGEALRLYVEGIEAPAVGANVRVFVNRPDAGPETGADDPRYAGEAGFFPLGEGAAPENSFLFDAGAVLDRLPSGERLVDGRYLDVTVVLVPPAAMPEDAEPIELDFEGVRLEAEPIDPPPD